MTISSEDKLAGVLRIGRVCGRVRDRMLALIEPGMTTAELDGLGAELLHRAGARSAPRLAYDFPGDTRTSRVSFAALVEATFVRRDGSR
jgi:methionyl aminopeptidase